MTIANAREDPKGHLYNIASKDDVEIDLAAAALALASIDRPRLSLERYRNHLAQIIEDTAVFTSSAVDLRTRATSLSKVLAKRYGYQGDTLTYEDMQNANLMRVIDRRKGLPVTLGILFIHAARSQGWRMVGLNFPYHFLVRLEAGTERLILDPFAGGRILNVSDLRTIIRKMGGADAKLEPHYFNETSNRAILVRLQNNIKSRALRNADIDRAADVLERTVMFAPDYAPAWRELGVLRSRQGNLSASVAAMESFLAREIDDAIRHEAEAFLQSLRAKLN